ncbi:P-loop containing nucleoside triphosphate hydrolase protein [Gloeopeniophorella convolvens]|nr:P-loop containing nucleoside triphosphate hydrolase protein [Gloeopeniophorella convolvens]
MAAYPRMDPYGQSRYEHGIDAKIVVMGNTGVGKTSLLQRYTQGKFDPKNTTSTTGAFFVTKKVSVGGVKVRLQLWDTAGQERFRSMAPMYYRGANAALLLYDITNQASFEDVRGWLEELRKNCAAELLIYIVGAKADLAPHRQVSPDRARASLHHWFPPPAPPPRPAPAPPSAAGFAAYAYIRPRFTSFTSVRTSPSSPHTPPSPESPPPLLQESPSRAGAALRRAQTGLAGPGGAAAAPQLGRAKSVHAGVRVAPPAWGEDAGPGMDADGWSAVDDADADADGVDEREWGLAKGMELFEVSAKDDSGVAQLFDGLIGAIVAARATIEHANELKQRDSVMLAPPAWVAQADEEEAREKAARARGAAWGRCCQT